MFASLQDTRPGHCFGCGPLNKNGLQIRSFWSGDEVVCAWRAQPHHIGYPGILYGGLIASVVDCHCIWTACAHAQRAAGQALDNEAMPTYVTASLQLNFRRPVPIDHAIELRARVMESSARKSLVHCTVTAFGQDCADAQVLAVRVEAEALAAMAAGAGARNAA